MNVSLKWFPPSWTQIKVDKKIIYIDPAYLRTYYTKYPKKSITRAMGSAIWFQRMAKPFIMPGIRISSLRCDG
jgi:hypothetical protein